MNKILAELKNDFAEKKINEIKTEKLIDFPNELLIKSFFCQSSTNLWFSLPLMSVCQRERERDSVCARVCVFVCQRVRERVVSAENVWEDKKIENCNF